MFNLKSSIRLTKKLFFFCVIHLMVSISNFLQGACERIEQNQTKGISNYPIISIQKYAYLWQTLTISLPYKHLTTFETLLYFYNKFINFFNAEALHSGVSESLKAVDFTAVPEYELFFCNNLWLQVCYILILFIICFLGLLYICGLDKSACSLPQPTTKIQKLISLTSP